VEGLETIKHDGPSSIGIDTLYRSEGHIPESFLRQAGVPVGFLTYLPSLMNRAIEYYSCFISYSSKDQEFVERLYADLRSKDVRCWYAPEDLKTGDKIRDRIERSIHQHDKLLLVLSQHSVNSSWVEFEVEAAFAKETSEKTLMLFPIRLDNAVKESPTSWAAHIRRTRNITDFSQWKEHNAYQKGLKRLLRDLQPDDPSEYPVS
jgi:TIR domain